MVVIVKILICYLGTDKIVQKTSHATAPLKGLSHGIWPLMTCMVNFRPKKGGHFLNFSVPCLGLELTIHVIKSQIHLVRQSL